MNNKKTKGGKSALRRVLESKRVYIALFSVMLVVGISVYSGRRMMKESASRVAFDDKAWQEALRESNITLTEVGEKEKAAEEVETIGIDAEEVKEDEPETVSVNADNNAVAENHGQTDEAEAAVEAAVVYETASAMQIPCNGRIIAQCSIDDLVYSRTMDDWRTHNGMDIAAEIGDPVKAAASGTVSKVYEDSLLGIVVEIDHGGGISTLYANLQSYDFIRVGTKVNAGDIVGGVGASGALESDTEPHLHFEVHKDGEYQSPSEYIGA